MPLNFYAIDNEFAAATGSNVDSGAGWSTFDDPPSDFQNLVVTVNEGDADPRLFEVGDSYDLSWSGPGGPNAISDAVVVRSDPSPDGTGGIIVFEGTDIFGGLTQIIWTPGMDLEAWYGDHYSTTGETGFYNTDIDNTYTHTFICFAEEVRLATAIGGIAAGELWEGDHVTTLDGGPQPIVWVGERVVPGRGRNAPVMFAPGTIGNHAPLRLSQQHRVMIRSPMAELMFGESEVLVPAKALVNGDTVRLAPCDRVRYVHFLLPAHHLVLAEGAPCESLLPGDRASAVSGVPEGAFGCGTRPARPILSFAEAVALAGEGRAARMMRGCKVTL